MLRCLASLLLSLVLACTSVTVAVARGQGPMTGTPMVLCTGDGNRTVILGPDGQPQKPRLACPDCFAALLGALPTLTGAALTPSQVLVDTVAPVTTATAPTSAPGLPQPRAPPLPV